jgi:hypothetical protein
MDRNRPSLDTNGARTEIRRNGRKRLTPGKTLMARRLNRGGKVDGLETARKEFSIREGLQFQAKNAALPEPKAPLSRPLRLQ